MPDLKDFGRKIMDSKSGTWFEITDKASAKLAGRASDTAIGYYYDSNADKVPHRWFYLVEDIAAERPKSPVCLAAVPADQAELGRVNGIDACHVTGHRNKNAYFDYEDELQALAQAEGIHMVPNYMGRLIRPKNEMDTQIHNVRVILDLDAEELDEVMPEGLTLETHNWDAMKAIRILDRDTPIAFLLEADEFGIHRVEVPEKGLELAIHKLGKHPKDFFEELYGKARRIELERDRSDHFRM